MPVFSAASRCCWEIDEVKLLAPSRVVYFHFFLFGFPRLARWFAIWGRPPCGAQQGFGRLVDSVSSAPVTAPRRYCRGLDCRYYLSLSRSTTLWLTFILFLLLVVVVIAPRFLVLRPFLLVVVVVAPRFLALVLSSGRRRGCSSLPRPRPFIWSSSRLLLASSSSSF